MKMNNWDTAVLGDFVKHQKGFAFKSKWFIDEGIPIVKVTDFTSSSIDKNSIQYIQEGIAEDKVKYKLKTGDSVIQTVGSWPNNPASVVGKAIQVPEELNDALLNQNAVILRPKEELKEPLDRFFLFYLLRSESYKGFIINTAQGAANQASITLDSIFRFPFYKPLLKTQKKIAAILSAYDDLIENNKRRIALLEKMAEEIYREWFVRFRFPGYQDAKFERGVPKGWKIEIVKKIVDRRKFGKIYRETDLNDMGSIVVIDQSRKDHLGFYDGEPQHRASINKPIILFGDHTCKMVLMVKDFSLAENVIPFTSKDKMPIYFFLKYN
jgi:type I restriction enzyme S subunit